MLDSLNKKLINELESPFHAYLLLGNSSSDLLNQATIFASKVLFGVDDKKEHPDIKIIIWAKKNNAKILITKDPLEAANLADCVMTDKWISMGDKGNKKKKRKLLKPYQVNKKIMK